MKCPKCGFNSFEFRDNCKKCGISLASFKTDLNIKPVIFNVDRPLSEMAPFLPDNAAAAPASEEAGDTFTWDMPEPEDSSSSNDANFSGFDLDFLKQDEKPVSPEEEFSFGEVTLSQAPAEPEQTPPAPPGDFSFYEETIEPGNQLFDGTADDSHQGGDSLFGQNGVIGEILPEDLQDDVSELDTADIIDESSPGGEFYEKEFDLGSFAVTEGETENKNSGVKNVSTDFTDFEKEFESIFQTDDLNDQDKPGI